MGFLFRLGAMLLWLFATIQVANYSMRWQSVSTVQQGVEVMLDGGERIKGELHHEWDGSYRLVSADGSDRRFKDFMAMTVPAPGFMDQSGSLTERNWPWRGILPLSVWMAITLWWHLFVGRRRLKGGEPRSK